MARRDNGLSGGKMTPQAVNLEKSLEGMGTGRPKTSRLNSVDINPARSQAL